MPAEQRQVRNVVESKGVKANEAYDRALIWFAKSLGNANWAVQIRDPQGKRIVANVKYHCTINTGSDILGNQNMIGFIADFQAKDDRFRLTFEDIIFTVRQQNGNEVVHGPTDEEQRSEIDQKCLIPVRDSITASVKGSRTVDDKF